MQKTFSQLKWLSRRKFAIYWTLWSVWRGREIGI